VRTLNEWGTEKRVSEMIIRREPNKGRHDEHLELDENLRKTQKGYRRWYIMHVETNKVEDINVITKS